MSKRVSNKKGRQRVAPARSQIHLGVHKRRRLNQLNEAAAKHRDNEEVLGQIQSAINSILPKRFFRRGVR